MSIAELLQSLVDILGSNQGIVSLGIAAAIAIGTPFVDRLVIRRKRIQYRVLYNSKIGLSPIFLETGGDTGPKTSMPTANPQLTQVAQLLSQLSVVIIRIRNTGSYDVTPNDFEPPLTFTFGRRVVWDARISDASDEQLRVRVRENLEFFTTADGAVTAPEADANRKLPALRKWLAPRLAAWLTPTPVPLDAPEPQWHGVRLGQLFLPRHQSFKLVVVLREAENATREISKDIQVRGGHRSGSTIIDEKRQRRFGWPVVLPAIGVMLVGALLATLIFGQAPRPVNGTVACAAGDVRLAGSSAFGPVAQDIGDRYGTECANAGVQVTVRVDSSGSIDGVRDLVGDDPSAAADFAALSDGATDEPTPGLAKRLVAVIVYSVVINRGVGIDQLTTAQLAGIYSGKYKQWSDLGGAALPIRIVGRGAGSGTRRAFERYVLGGSSEGVLSSDDCLTRDRIAGASTIRCERTTTEDLVHTVASVPGAIGYADVSNATTKDAVRGGQLVTVQLDGRSPQVDSLPEYPFWTVEYLYTRGEPASRSALGTFLTYLASDAAQATLFGAGYTPCVAKDGVLNHLCTLR